MQVSVARQVRNKFKISPSTVLKSFKQGGSRVAGFLKPKNKNSENDDCDFTEIDKIVKQSKLSKIKASGTSTEMGGVLHEFFFDADEFADPETFSPQPPAGIIHGDAWSLELLRTRNTVDLHKIWFVLLKEKNRLLACRHEFIRHKAEMPSLHRLDKVAESMDNLRTVLEEREKAKNMLFEGKQEKHPGQYVQVEDNGTVEWRRYKEYAIPKDEQPKHLQELERVG